MPHKIACYAIAFLVFVTLGTQSASGWQQSNVGRSSLNMVASVHPLATRAGIDAMVSGGNAIDAAIAAGMMLSVVDGYNSGIGGGCFILIRTADGKLFAIDGREMAPAAAHRDMYLVDGEPDGSLSQTGALAIGVPGALAAYELAVNEHGKMDFSALVRPAVLVARDGFEVSGVYAGLANGAAKALSQFPGSKAVLTKTDVTPWKAGDKLVQTDLANTLRNIANRGSDYFYKGDFAKRMGDWMQANDGIMTAEDFANYETRQRTPVETTYRGHTIVGFPPPSSGGVHVAQILNILENFDLKKLHDEDYAKFVHVVAEAMKLAFADRAHWLGDPDYAKVPKGLIDKTYAEQLAARIDMAKASEVKSHGTPPLADAELFERHTTHVTAADSKGNWVAITTTVNTTFGSKVIVPGLGVIMNNQMDDFSIAPGTPNAYGLVGSESNSVQAGKRPLSSMSPTIVLKDGKPIMTVGAAGGPKIITQALLAIIRRIDLGLGMDDAVGNKRFHHQWSPDILFLENGFDESIAKQLEEMGHKTRFSNSAGVSQAILFDEETKEFVGVHDPRVPGSAEGEMILQNNQ